MVGSARKHLDGLNMNDYTLLNGCVYTCLFGDLEPLNFDRHPESKLKHIIFSDRQRNVPDGCELVIIESSLLESKIESRRPKILPQLFLSGYKWSLYVDNRIAFKSAPDAMLIEHISSSPDKICMYSHPWRNCLYDEGEEIIRLGLEDESVVRKQLDFYSDQGCKSEVGLYACTIILRDHNDDAVKTLCINWFDHYLNFSKRDQVSFAFLRAKQGVIVSELPGSLISNSFFDWCSLDRADSRTDFKRLDWLLPPSYPRDREHLIAAAKSSDVSAQLKRKPVWQLTRLCNKYRSDKGSLYYNAHGYSYVYEYALRHLRNQSFTFLEVGLLRHDVQHRQSGNSFSDAPSLRVWEEYFSDAKIVGFDIQDFSAVDVGDRVSIHRGDSSSSDDLERLFSEIESPLVIIEDASHASHHQQTFLNFAVSKIRDGGHLFIEDLHYQPPKLELEGIPKTRDILYELRSGRLSDSAFFSSEAQALLLSRAKSIEFFDSRDLTFDRIQRDALCHIRF